MSSRAVRGLVPSFTGSRPSSTSLETCDFARAGVVGEEANKLVGYLAALSRKLPEPLAVIVQSGTAAGKSVLMEAVLAFVPPEERVQYSAVTGQASSTSPRRISATRCSRSWKRRTPSGRATR